MSADSDFDRARTLAGVGRLEETTALLEAMLAADLAHRGALILRASLHAGERATRP